MGDEQGDVGPGCGSVSEASSRGESLSECPVEKLGDESHVEVMVEVVGSDVLVDGVSGQKDGDLGFGEIGNLQGNVEKRGKEIGVSATKVSNERDGNGTGESEVGVELLTGGCKCVDMEEVDASVSEPVDGGNKRSVGLEEVGDLEGGTDKNGGKSGVNATETIVESEVGFEGSMGGRNDVVAEVVTCVRNGEGAASELESKDVSVLENEVLNAGIESVVLSTSADEVAEKSTVVIHGKKVIEDEPIDKSSRDLVASEHLDCPGEIAGEEKVDSEGKEGLLSSNDGAAGHNWLGEDPVMTSTVTVAAEGDQVASSDVSLDPHCECSDDVLIGGIEGGIGGTRLVNATEGEVLDTGSPKDGGFMVKTESASSDGAKSVDEKEVLAVESEGSSNKSHAVVIQVENNSSLKESRGIMSQTNHMIDDTHEKTLSSGSGVTDLVNQHHVFPDDASKESNGTYEKMEVDCMKLQVGTAENISETDKLKSLKEETRPIVSVPMYQSSYLLCQENEGHYNKSDLVWGKVRSHPWWPGQIFEPEDASEAAVKYYKKDSYLVAYFGDRTFAWNDALVLKPFRSHFSQIEKQSSSEAFQNAVDCALEEVSRRLELGLACSCIPKDAFQKIECQLVENSGIREESSCRYGVDLSTSPATFEPMKLLEYIIDLAPCASFGADRLDLVIVQAQLSAFCCFKGYRLPTEFPSSGELLENESDNEKITVELVSSEKQRRVPIDGSLSRKERRLVELMGDGEFYPDVDDEPGAEGQGKLVTMSSWRKRKALDALDDGLEKRPTISAAKLSSPRNQPPKSSFKIGECIRRVASQLTGSMPLVKGGNDEMIDDSYPNINECPVNDILSQLEALAGSPKKRQNMPGNIHNFFLGFRSSISLNRRGRKRKTDQSVSGSGEDFEFDDVNDSYWMERIVNNYPAELLLHDGENGGGDHHLVPSGEGKSVKLGRKTHSRKRYSAGSYPTETPESEEIVIRKKQQSSPAELILNFGEKGSVPSELNLNKMFRRFGSLMESETQADHESGRAKVIFKRGSDAEVARNSAEKFNIFGSALVNYEIGYSPVISVKILPVTIPQLQEDEGLMI